MAKNSLWGVFRKLVGVPSPHVEEKEGDALKEKQRIEPKQKVQPEEIVQTTKPAQSVKPPKTTPTVQPQPSVEREPLVQTKAEKQFFQILERAGTGAPIFQEDLQAFAELLKSGIQFDQSGGAKNALAIEYICDTYFPNPGLLKLLLEHKLDPKTKWGNNAPILVLINRGFEAYSKGHIDDNDEDLPNVPFFCHHLAPFVKKKTGKMCEAFCLSLPRMVWQSPKMPIFVRCAMQFEKALKCTKI